MPNNLIKLCLKFRVQIFLQGITNFNNWKRKSDEITHDTVQKPICFGDLISRHAYCK